MERALINTPLGTAVLEGDQDGLQCFKLIEEQETNTPIPPCLQKAAREIEEYFSGDRTAFTIKTNPHGTPFQKKVWQLLQNIPYGKTISYADLADRLGDKKTIRAAASANGKNPLWIIIPCHRVIGSDGSLTGYAGGLWRKKWLLEKEQGIQQASLF